MDQTEIQQKWPEIKKKIISEYPHLTEEELLCEIGKEKEHLEQLQSKLGKNWTEIRNWLSLLG